MGPLESHDFQESLPRIDCDGVPVQTALPTIYKELRRIAAACVGALPSGQTLQPTAIVNELFVRGFVDGSKRWESRAHFFGAASIAIRNLLVERARRRRAARAARELHAQRTSSLADGMEDSHEALLALDDALNKLKEVDERKYRVVTLRFFAGLSIQETARTLDMSTATVERDWAFARAWLQFEILRTTGREE